jgi:hypothetical protein
VLETVSEGGEVDTGFLTGGVTLRTAGLPSTIRSIVFERSAGEADRWTEVPNEGGPTSTHTQFETHGVADGLYDLRVIVTDGEGATQEALLRDQVVANNSAEVEVGLGPGQPLAEELKLPADLGGTVGNQGSEAELGEITMSPIVAREHFPIASASFQYRGVNGWVPIKTEPVKGAPFAARFNSKEIGEGRFDFRIVGQDENGDYVSIPARDRLIDNAPPAVEMVAPGSQLHGHVMLSANAQDGGSGVAAVAFERADAGSAAWHRIGETTHPPFVHALNTEALPNGRYDLRATALDRVGNRGVSQVVHGVEVANRPLPPVVSGSIQSVVAPAEDVSMLGAVAGSHPETWAYGFTSAPPAQVNGSPLPYTALGHQLVLLRHTDETGWQIADVLRDPGGTSAFPLLPREQTSGVSVTGSMTPSGEAWLWLDERSVQGQSVFGLFHRRPGGAFELDPQATKAMCPTAQGCPLLESLGLGDRLQLGETREGSVYGMLTAHAQPAVPGQLPVSGGGEVPLSEALAYGILQNGAWKLESAPPPPALDVHAGDTIALQRGDLYAPGQGWAVFTVANGEGRGGLILGHLQNGGWSFAPTGLDALDLAGILSGQEGFVEPLALKADAGGAWVEAKVNLHAKNSGLVVAHLDSSGKVTNSWCTLTVPSECEEPLDLDHPARVPDAIFEVEGRPVALALRRTAARQEPESVDVFANGQWTSYPAPGHTESEPDEPGGGAAFSSPNEGWLGGASALGRWGTQTASGLLTPWPLSDRAPLTAVALPPGSPGGANESGALAVGLEGTTLRYDSTSGWLVQPVPLRSHHIGLLGVAFSGLSSAVAVGQFGAILRWDGSAWSEDRQSTSVTHAQLNSVAFAPSGEGWAVGTNGTILHFDGRAWSRESPPGAEADTDITSVAVAGSDVFAVAGGTLIQRASDGTWEDAPAPPSTSGRLRVVAGLPDGGAIAAGVSLVLVRETSGTSFQYSAQPLQGIAVALAPFRQADGRVGAYASVAPPASGRADVGGSPAGDGELLRETGGGWQDVSGAQFAGNEVSGDGSVKSDPVLAVASAPDGAHAWAVGGYAGTLDAAAQGTKEPFSSEAGREWMSASVWRYDSAGQTTPPALKSSAPSIPARAGTVSFAFFSDPMCRFECAAVADAQPDVNLTAAGAQIAAFAAQPGGPAFAMLGGNARGPVPLPGAAVPSAANRAIDFAHLPALLASLGGPPTFAALGPLDYVSGEADPTQPWAEAFAEAPAPFASGSAGAVTPVSAGPSTPSGLVHTYYAFDAHQSGGTLRVVVLDDSRGSLGADQTGWLRAQLENAQSAHVPVVAFAAEPLHAPYDGKENAADGAAVASLLASHGAVAVFTAGQLDERRLVPESAAPGTPQIPEYEGASLGYQQHENDGVKWYFVSVDVQGSATRDPAAVSVSAIPVVSTLSLKPLDGQTVARSLTLRFEAIGRRPPGTLATRFGESPPFAGYDQYVGIPAPECSESRPGCVKPSYSFTSSDPTIGDFVLPTSPNSQFPLLDANKHPIPSSSSALFCAFNSGTTIVSVTAGLLSYSLPVTVQPGGFGAPCGTVPRANQGQISNLSNSQVASRLRGATAPPAPPPAALAGTTPAISLIQPPPVASPPAVPPAAPQPPPPLPKPSPAPIPLEPAPIPQVETLGATPAIVTPATPPVEPIPPGASGYAQSPSAAKRREEARKHASQSAYVVRPAGADGEEWFYAAAGLATVLVLLLGARSLPARPGPRPALAREHTATQRRGRREAAGRR